MTPLDIAREHNLSEAVALLEAGGPRDRWEGADIVGVRAGRVGWVGDEILLGTALGRRGASLGVWGWLGPVVVWGGCGLPPQRQHSEDGTHTGCCGGKGCCGDQGLIKCPVFQWSQPWCSPKRPGSGPSTGSFQLSGDCSLATGNCGF